MADLEASTFQKRPCYRYIRKSDKLPPLGSKAKIAKVKLFDPSGSWTWYLSEYDPESRQAFGLVDGIEKEYGYIDMAELIAVRGIFGLPIERDLWWKPQPLASLKQEERAMVAGSATQWVPAIESQYRVWYSRNGHMFYAQADSPEEGQRIIEEQTKIDLRNSCILMNVFGLEEHDDDGQWHDWYDEEGHNIYEHFWDPNA